MIKKAEYDMNAIYETYFNLNGYVSRFDTMNS